MAACSLAKKSVKANEVLPVEIVSSNLQPVPGIKDYTEHETNQNLRKKYAQILNVPPDSIANLQLYKFIDKWLNTPFRWGGTDEDGIDCSAFIQRLFNEVYRLEIPRTSNQQLYANYVEKFSSLKHISEGDILFFKTITDDKLVSHVGIYLANNRFINSSSSKGVSIANLSDFYWRKCFVAAGRIKVKNK